MAEPCPLGMLISRKRRGACHALRWDAVQLRYICGFIAMPGDVLPITQPWVLAQVQRLAYRWIASGIGCDADLQIEDISTP